jgi:hypothetical protein
MRWRLKGNSDGPVFSGTQLAKPCATCGPGVEFRPLPPKRFTETPARHPRAVVWPWLSVAARWRELEFSIRSVVKHLDDVPPMIVLCDKALDWAASYPVEFIEIPEYAKSREAGLFRAFEIGMQVADEVLWMNDDIYLLKDLKWDDFRVALTEGDLTESGLTLLRSSNQWQQGLGASIETLKLRGIETVWRFATHTPYLFEREKSLEIFKEFHLPYKGGWVTLYHNWHRTPHRSCGRWKVNTLPTDDPEARFLNHNAKTPSASIRSDLIRRFGP